ncbi:MAG: hypothetical protein OXH09_02525 [Gammaproteobacteria bacterium]|nr:hypothetical protein [Gammaproteobacteria bacterium]
MNSFNRGLDSTFVAAFNEEYDGSGWLRGLVDDKDIFLAVRQNYVNFYHLGSSLLKLECLNGALVGQIHYKYLLRPDADNPYIKTLNGRPDLPNDAKELFLLGFEDVKALKTAARPYAGPEKTGVHNIVRDNPNILDVEIAFGTGGADEARASAPRVDFAAIRCANERATVVLYEAKHFDNRQALRSEQGNVPKVVEQIEAYSDLLETYREEVITSYRCVCCNLLALRGLAERHPERQAMLKKIADGSRKLKLDPHPRLVVFGFDADQRSGDNWRPHRDRLRKLLNGRLLLKGHSEKFVRGISR